MEVTIDGAGRIVIPKPLREQLGLEAGTALDLTATGDEIRLSARRRQPSLVNVDGVWVHRGKARRDLARAVERMREDRLRDLASGL